MEKKVVAIVNLTPHDINLFDDEGRELRVIFKSEGVARLKTKAEPVTPVYAKGRKIPLIRQEVGEVEGLPSEPIDGVYFIVSRLIFDALPERKDLIVPDTSPESVVRDSEGRIIGVRRFIIR